ncbi:MAG TPA: iron-siderophore ABC transporter substrate-binding protein [Thermomicrobiales bacterium]|jgi:iron complex transport system substrate-binding protein
MPPLAHSTVLLTRRRFLTGLGTTGAVALGLAACGGSTPPTTAPPTSPAAAPATALAASSAPSPAPAIAAAAPSVATGATPTGTPAPQGLRLIPAKPADLGAPAVLAATKSTAAAPTPYEPAVAAYDPFGTDAAPGVFPRTIRHATGTTEIKTKPERILPLDSGELDAVVQLGLKPVGYLDYNAALMPAHLVTALQGVPTIGTLAEPKLEAIAAIRPELMLTTKVRHEKLADSLKAIAPTVFGISTGVVWKQNFALYAKSLGREAEADVAVRGYEERVRKLNAALPSPRPTISVIRVLNNNLRYYQRANYSGTILTDLGFQRPPSQNVDDFALLNQSSETLGASGDADHIVVCFTEGENGAFAREFIASPLWQSLGAVKRGAVLFALDDVWMAGIGYRAADLILSDIARYFKI